MTVTALLYEQIRSGSNSVACDHILRSHRCFLHGTHLRGMGKLSRSRSGGAQLLGVSPSLVLIPINVMRSRAARALRINV